MIYTNRSYKAFSLIELMVVIAIVAVIAFFAIPAYKQYTIKTKIMSTFMPVLDKLKKDSIKYAAAKGSFPTAAQLGYPVLAPPFDYIFVTGAATTLNPFFTSGSTYIQGDTCGAYSAMQFTTPPTNMGYSDGTTFIVTCVIWHKASGIIDTGCYVRTDASMGLPKLPYPFINSPYPTSLYQLGDGYYDAEAGVNRGGYMVNSVCQ